MKKLLMLIVFVAALFLTAGTYAATVTTSDDSDFDLLSGAWITTGPEGSFSFGQDDSVSLGQTFTVEDWELELMSVNLTYESDTGKGTTADHTLTMHIFEVADSYAASITVPATTLLTDTFVTPYVGGSDTTLTITLDSVLTLAANTSYAVWFDTSDASGVHWEWFRSSSASPGGGNEYAGGAFYDGGAIKTGGERDGSLALVGVVHVPMVDAGVDRYLADAGAVELMGEIVNYDPLKSYTYTWSGAGVSFTTPVTVVDPNCPTTATFPEPGEYTLTLGATNSYGSTSDTVTVVVLDPAVHNLMVGHWKLDTGSGNTIVDTAGNYPGTAVTTNWQAGWVGCGLSSLWFDGDPNTEVAIPSHATVDPNGLIPDDFIDNIQYGVTIAAWVNTVPTGSSQRILIKDDAFELRIQDDGTVRLKIWNEQSSSGGGANMTDSDESDLGAGMIIADGNWRHVAATYSIISETAAVYVDGILIHEEAISRLIWLPDPIDGDPDLTTFIGGNYVGGIDDVRLYNYALDPAAIEALAAAGDSAPLVGAGQNMVHQIGGLLQLQGFVGDLDSSPTIKWTVTGGNPGSVTFTDDTDPMTTVDFSPADPNTFVLQLSATDTLACGSQIVEVIDTIFVSTFLPTCADVITDGLTLALDVTGPVEGVPDCYVDMYELVYLAKSWLSCNDPENQLCEWPW